MQIGTLEIARALARLLRITGAQPQLELASDLLPVVNAFNLDDPPYHFKRGAVWNGQIAAVIGQYGSAAIGANSGSTVVVRQFDVINCTGALQSYAAEFSNDINIPAGLTVVAALDWDNRGTQDSGSVSPARIRAGASATPVGGGADFISIGQLNSAVGARGIIPCPLVLRAGDYLRVAMVQSNVLAQFEILADVYEA